MNPTIFTICMFIFIFWPAIVVIFKFMPKLVNVLAALSVTRQRPSRHLLDPVPAHPDPFSREELRALLQGHFADYGRDTHTHQRFLLSESDRCKSSVILGPPGSGKTTFLVSSTLARDIASPGNSVVVMVSEDEFTPLVETLAQTYGRRIVIYPDIGFNPLNLVSTNAFERAERFNDVLAQVRPAHGEDRHYLDQQKLFVRLMVPLYEEVYHQPMIPYELWELCVIPARRKKLLADAGASGLAQRTRLVIESWATLSHEISGLVNFLDSIMAGENMVFYNQRHAPNLEQVIDDQVVCVIREGGDPGTEAHARGVLFMVALQQAVLARPENAHFLALYVDEFHRYINPSYPNFAALSRRHRVAQVLSFQTLGHLPVSEGLNYRNAILSCARTWILHTGVSPEDAEYFAEAIGKRGFEFTSLNRSQNGLHPTANSQGQILSYDYLMHPHEIRNLDGHISLILSVKGLGIDAPRLVEKPAPIQITPSHYHIPHPKPIMPPTIWDTTSIPTAKSTPNPPASAPLPHRTSPANQPPTTGAPSQRINAGRGVHKARPTHPPASTQSSIGAHEPENIEPNGQSAKTTRPLR